MAQPLFIITMGEYSDYGIVRAFTDRALAERWLEKLNRNGSEYDTYRIEEWEITDAEPVLRTTHYLNQHPHWNEPRAHSAVHVVGADEQPHVAGPRWAGTSTFHASGPDLDELYAQHAKWEAAR